jgi:hypothetical protein
MKPALFILTAFCAVTAVACGSAQKPEPSAATSSSALTAAPAAETKTKSAAEEWAEKKVAAEVASSKKNAKESSEGADPLAMNSELEESSIPKMEMTPANQVRAKSPGELHAAMGVVKSASSVDGAAKKLTQRLGKPNWTESPKSSSSASGSGEAAKRRIWVATSGTQCQRLILEADGSVEVETASKTEWRMLAASARQNPCTGEIKRGISK